MFVLKKLVGRGVVSVYFNHVMSHMTFQNNSILSTLAFENPVNQL